MVFLEVPTFPNEITLLFSHTILRKFNFANIFACVLFVLFVVVFLVNQGGTNGKLQTSSSPPVIFIAGRPKAALLSWFFGDFRCGALLFMVIHVLY